MSSILTKTAKRIAGKQAKRLIKQAATAAAVNIGNIVGKKKRKRNRNKNRRNKNGNNTYYNVGAPTPHVLQNDRKYNSYPVTGTNYMRDLKNMWLNPFNISRPIRIASDTNVSTCVVTCNFRAIINMDANGDQLITILPRLSYPIFKRDDAGTVQNYPWNQGSSIFPSGPEVFGVFSTYRCNALGVRFRNIDVLSASKGVVSYGVIANDNYVIPVPSTGSTWTQTTTPAVAFQTRAMTSTDIRKEIQVNWHPMTSYGMDFNQQENRNVWNPMYGSCVMIAVNGAAGYQTFELDVVGHFEFVPTNSGSSILDIQMPQGTINETQRVQDWFRTRSTYKGISKMDLANTSFSKNEASSSSDAGENNIKENEHVLSEDEYLEYLKLKGSVEVSTDRIPYNPSKSSSNKK